MPNPKNYIDDEHSYVRGYVRRKHTEKTQTTEPIPQDIQDYIDKVKDRHEKLIIASWIIHIVALIVLGMFTFIRFLDIVWRIGCGIVFAILLIVLINRITNWWEDRL